MESRASFQKTAIKVDRVLGFISSNISTSADNLIDTTQKINYTQPL
jgi:hypothetical protein